MKTLLVQPPSYRNRFNISGVYPMAPLGPAYLAAALREAGVSEPAILDVPAWRLPPEKVEAALVREDYDLYGLSATVFHLRFARDLARACKRLRPGVPTVLGGPATVFPPETILHHVPEIDYVLSGEGEAAFVELHRAIAKKSGLEDVPNLSWREEGRVRTNPAAPYLDLDRIPRPALDLLPLHRYRIAPPFCIETPIMLVETMRGCSYRCSFCTLPRDVRMRSVDAVVEELVDLVHRRGTRELYVVDPTFTIDRDRAMRLLDAMAREKLNVRWTCKTRADHVDQELLDAMARAGCYMVSYGLESGSQRILDNLMKDIDASQNERAIAMTRKAGMRSIAYILIGSPGEDDLSVAQTVRMVRRMRPDFVLYGELQADPASAATANAVRDGAYRMEDVVDYYLHGKDEALRGKTLTKIPKTDVERWISRAGRDFYARPSYILRRLADVRTPRDFGNLFAGVFHVLADKHLSADAI